MLRYGDDLAFDLALGCGWNLVSLPIEPLDPSVEAVLDDGATRAAAAADLRDGFCGTIPAGTVWTRGDRSHVAAEEMHACTGYWVHACSATVMLVAGLPADQESLSLLRGWNLNGTEVPRPVPTDDRIVGYPWELSLETLRYHGTTTLLPGSGYWVNVSEDAVVPLTARQASRRACRGDVRRARSASLPWTQGRAGAILGVPTNHGVQHVLNNQIPLPAGKLPPEALAGILEIAGPAPAEVIVPPALGEDSAVLRLPGGLMAVGADPITFLTPSPGHFAVCVNANDLAVTGARPEYFTLTILLPERSTAEQARTIVSQAVASGREVGATLIGGHTEVTASVSVPVLAVTMFGHLMRATPLRTGGAQAGDRLLQVNPYALEGTAILASERAEELAGSVSADDLAAGRALLDDPGICIVRPALLAAEFEEVHAMHDPTEGGIATGVREMAEAAALGVRLRREALCELPVTGRICAALGIDPLGLISSGCLLMAVAPDEATRVCEALQAAGHPVAEIGEFTASPEMLLSGAGEDSPLPYFAVDELAAQ